MPTPAPVNPDDRFEHFLGTLLQIGVFIAAAVVLFGGTVYLIRHWDEAPDYGKFHDESSPLSGPDARSDLRSPRGIIGSARAFRGRGIIQLGVLLLIATPVARVAFSVLGFARQRDLTYVGLTLFVLAVLAYSLFFEGR